MSGENASGYYGNAIGGAFIAWIYGWGYYIYQGTIYKSTLMEGDKNRKDRISLIKSKLERAVHRADEEDDCEDDIKYLLEEVMELGISSFESDSVVEDALRYNFHGYKESNSRVSSCPDFKNYIFNQEEVSKLAAKVGFYEILDVAGKYLGQQRLYGKLNRSRFIEVFLIFAFVLDFLVITFTGLIPYWQNFYSCEEHGHPVSPAFNCNAGIIYFLLFYT